MAPPNLFLMNRTGYTLFHGAFPDRFELQIPTRTLRDERTGQLILPQIIDTARGAGEEGGFVRYFFDNPDDPDDDFNTLKVSYVREVEVRIPLPDGTVLQDVLIIGAGIYGDPDAVATAQDCPRPAGVPDNPLATPSPTAGEVTTGAGTLGQFAQAARDYFNSITTPEELGYAGCITRNEGPWKSGPIYLSAVTLDGRVFFNADDMTTGGRPLNPLVYGAILAALGIDVTSQDTITAGLQTVFATGTFPNTNGGPVPGVGGYAVGYGTNIPYILLAGLNLHELLLAPETLEPAEPEITAEEVVDRRTLKKFVNGAIDYLTELQQMNPTGVLGIARSVLRRPPWRHGEVYLFVTDEEGYTHLHGAFPDRFEFQKPTDTLRDVVTGKLILPQIIDAAQKPGGGFVSYNFDNPDDDSDSADVPKVTYARQVEYTFNIPGVGPITNAFIVGAGIYGDPVSKESTAAAKSWLARFGRAAAGQTVEMISNRLSLSSPGTSQVKIAGRTLTLDDLRSPQTLGNGFNGGTAGDGLPGVWNDRRTASWSPSARDLLLGSSFHLSAMAGGKGSGPGGRGTVWGQAGLTQFGGSNGASFDGEVVTGMLGADYEWGRMLAGLAVSYSSGDGGFDLGSAADGRSVMEASLTSVHPYLRYALSERLSVWGLFGYGRGKMSLREDDVEKLVETDIAMTMGALGARGEILSASQTGGFDLAVKSDVFLTQVKSDEESGLKSITAEAMRVRLGLEGSGSFAIGQGGMLRPSVEVGVRYDGGDAETGTGLELGGGLRYANPGSGLTMEARARGLAAHGESGYREWGVGGSVRLEPGASGRGLSLTLTPSWGVVSSGVNGLWSRSDVAGLAAKDDAVPGGRLDAELGYGLDALSDRGLLTPYAGVALSAGGGRNWRVGGRYSLGSSFNLKLEGTRRETVKDNAPDHGVMLWGSVPW